MTRIALAFVGLVALGGCYRPDPTVAAAQNFQRTAFDLIAKDDEQTKRLNSLHLGMSDTEVVEVAGPPSRRESGDLESSRSRETWTYSGELKHLADLVFEDRHLVEIQTY